MPKNDSLPTIAVCTTLFFIFTTFSNSQNTAGNIEGNIIDTTGNSLVGVNIFLHSTILQGTRGATTNEEGYFRILSLPVGEYIVSISAVGFGSLNIEKVQVLLGKTTNLGDIKLQSRSSVFQRLPFQERNK